MRLIFSYIRRHALLYAVGIAFLTVEALADLLQPTLMSYIVNDGVQQKDLGQILVYGAIMLGIALLGAVAAIVRNNLSCRASQAIGAELRSDMYRKVQDLSFENIDRLQPASIVTRLTNDVTVVTNFSASLMRIAVKVPITAVGAFVLLVIQAPRQLPVILVIVVVVGWLISLTMRLSRPRFMRMQQAMDRLNGVSREWLSAVRVVKAFGAEPHERARFDEATGDVAESTIAASRVPATFVPLINLVANLGIVVLLWRSQTHDAAEIGNLMAAVNYMTQLVMSLGMINMVLNEAVRAVTSASRIGEVLDERPAQTAAANPQGFGAQGPRGAVRFENVGFSYAGSLRPALDGISFDARPGETVGIIGPTGSGKSSLVNLVPRFYDATRGAVLLDGRDVTALDERELRRAVAVVPQRPLLFSGSIADNLRHLRLPNRRCPCLTHPGKPPTACRPPAPCAGRASPRTPSPRTCAGRSHACGASRAGTAGACSPCSPSRGWLPCRRSSRPCSSAASSTGSTCASPWRSSSACFWPSMRATGSRASASSSS